MLESGLSRRRVVTYMHYIITSWDHFNIDSDIEINATPSYFSNKYSLFNSNNILCHSYTSKIRYLEVSQFYLFTLGLNNQMDEWLYILCYLLTIKNGGPERKRKINNQAWGVGAEICGILKMWQKPNRWVGESEESWQSDKLGKGLI